MLRLNPKELPPVVFGQGENSMAIETTFKQFLDELASDSPAPGGGSAGAAVGAMGAALVSMVCRLTIGKEKFAAVAAELQEALVQADALRAELNQLVIEDSAAFNQVMAAFRLPKETTEEKVARGDAIQSATQQATLAPLATARACAQVIELSRLAAEKGNPNALSDAGAAAACAQAGLKAASLNVLINLPSIKDEAFVAARQAELEQILSKLGLADEVYELVKRKI
jgi:formiminotetrahydrofolate cyclodeaminase